MAGYDTSIFSIDERRPSYDRDIFSIPKEAPDIAKKDDVQEKLARETAWQTALLVGAGSKTNDILNGITQAYLRLRGDNKALSGLKTNVEEQKSFYSPLVKAHPFATAVGESLPLLAVPGAGTGMKGAFMAGAAPEALSYGTAEERASNALKSGVGSAVGYKVASALPRMLNPHGVGYTANPDALAAAKRIGYQPLPGQATRSPVLLNIENYLLRSPGASGTMRELTEAQQTAINRAGATSIGQKADDVSAGVLKAAETDLGNEFARLQAITRPVLGNDFVNALVKVEAKNATLGSFRDKAVDDALEKAMDLASKGNLSGSAYKEIHTELARQSSKAYAGGDATLGGAIKDIRKALDNAAKQSLSPDDQKAWDLVRKQWSNWKTITKGNVAEGGLLSPARTAAALRAKDPGFRTGKSQGLLEDVGVIGEGMKTAINPNSSSLWQTMLYGNPFTGLPLTLANKGAVEIYTNPLVQKYMRQGILDVGKNGELVIKATGKVLGASEAKQLGL